MGEGAGAYGRHGGLHGPLRPAPGGHGQRTVRQRTRQPVTLPGVAIRQQTLAPGDAERLRAAHLKVRAAEQLLNEAREARDAVIRASLDAGASRYEIAGASGLTQPGVAKIDARTRVSGETPRLT